MTCIDDYTRERLNRREFIRRLSVLAGGTAAALALMPVLENSLAQAQIVSKDDPRLVTEYIKYPGLTGDIRAYLARPKGTEKLPAVLVIHENGGWFPISKMSPGVWPWRVFWLWPRMV